MRPFTERPAIVAALLLALAGAGGGCKRPGRAPAIWVSAGEGTACFGMKDGTVRCASERPDHPVLHGHPGGPNTAIPELRGHTGLVLGAAGACSLAPESRALTCTGLTASLCVARTTGGDVQCRGEVLRHPDEACSGATFACAREGDAVSCAGDPGTPLGPAFEGPPRPIPGLAPASQLTCGEGHLCALSPKGEVRCVGANLRGQLGRPASSPPEVAYLPVLRGVAEVRAGRAHTCARFVNGTVACWGALGPAAPEAHVARVYPGLFGVARLAAAGDATYAVTREGGVFGWGTGVVPAHAGQGGQRVAVPTPIFLRP